MKIRLIRYVSIMLVMTMLSAILPAPVSAAPVSAAPAIISVVPAQVVNDVSTTITVNGSGFSAGSAVVLLNGSALSTTVVNDAVLTAVVPARFAAGCHTVVVSNGVAGDPDATWSCLDVVAPTPTPPPTSTTVPLPFVRPQLVVKATTTKGAVQTSQEFKLNVAVQNDGTSAAYSVQAVLSSTDLVPLKNGGVSVLGTLNAGEQSAVVQTFLVNTSIYGQTIVVVDLTLTYYDDKGTSFSDKFTLTITASGGVSGGVAAATSTPTGVKSSQLVISGYSSDVELLQPGDTFTIAMTVQNVGNAKAQRVTMIVGGGSGGTSGGTPQPGGVSGGSGDFANFAPVGASNVQSLGDLNAGDHTEAKQQLIVNVSTNPGAYPMKVTFSYLNDKNEVINDEQVITLLVYSLPNLDISFYRPPDQFLQGQSGVLPIQVVNLGRRTSVLGALKVSAANGLIENGTSLVGSLDAGGYFTIDSFFTPDQAGTNTLEVTIDYLDDFNQPRTITRTVEVEVAENMVETPDPSEGGGLVIEENESLLQKAWRFILGLFGLDSAPPSGDDSAPIEEKPIEAAPDSGEG
jgi:hypothetical protein